GRPGEVEQACRSAMILHERKPFEVILPVWNRIYKMNRLALEDAKNAFFLLWPGAPVHSEGHKVTRQRAEQRRRSISLASKRPVLIRGIADNRKVLFPRSDPNDLIPPALALTAQSHKYLRSDPVRPIANRD